MSGISCVLAGSGGLGGVVSLPASINPNAANPGGSATATLLLTTAGAYAPTNDAGGNYVTPTSLAGQLEARLTQNSGFAISGATLGAWLALTANRSWAITSTAGTTRIATATLEIREAATGLVRATCPVTFTADSV